MKALTVKQPWAHLICSGIKDVENRTWKTNFRGRVLIHASAKPERINTLGETFSIEQLTMISHHGLSHGFRFRDCDENSAIIGSVEIVDCVQEYDSIWAEKGVWNWVLANPVVFDKPIENVKGKLSFWEYQLKI